MCKTNNKLKSYHSNFYQWPGGIYKVIGKVNSRSSWTTSHVPRNTVVLKKKIDDKLVIALNLVAKVLEYKQPVNRLK